MPERRASRLVSAGPRAKRVKLGGSRLVSAGPRAKRVKLGGVLLTRYNRGGELRPRSSAKYPNSSLYGVEGGAPSFTGRSTPTFDKVMSYLPKKALSTLLHGSGRRAGSGYVNSGGSFAQDFLENVISGKTTPASLLDKFVRFTHGGSGSSDAAPNKWVEHVRRFAKAHQMSYGEALRAARPSYRGGRGAH